MATDLEKYLSKQLVEAQTKYTYFLLAIAASAIALVVRRTTGSSLDWNMLLLGASVLFWAISFFAGCRSRLSYNSSVYGNMELVKLQSGKHPQAQNNEDLIEAGVQVIRDTFKKNQSKLNFWVNIQFRLLVLGAIFFLAWHIVEMGQIDIGSMLFSPEKIS